MAAGPPASERTLCGDETSDAEKQPSIGAGRPLPPPLPDAQHYVVEFDGPADPYHPCNWSRRKKVLTAALVCSGTLIASFSSAVFAPAIAPASRTFSVAEEVATLGTTLYVLGLVAGPLLWAPASELCGRRWPLAGALVAGGIFSIGAAAAKDVQTLLLCRFFAGACGASPFSIVPGVLSDLYDNNGRGVAISLYALTVFCGPYLAPIVGGFIVLSSSSSSASTWRWTLYLPAILSLVTGAASLALLPETYAPCLLADKAARLRYQTGNWGIHARHERARPDDDDDDDERGVSRRPAQQQQQQQRQMQRLLRRYFARPLKLLCTEPIILVVSLYMSAIYGLVYALLEAYPDVFARVYGMAAPGVASLPFVGPLVGVLLGCALVVSQHGAYARRLAAHGGVPVPEWRLRPAIIGAPIFAVGFFWFGWTAFTPSIHWAVPAVAGVAIGFGTFCVFLPCFNYLVDAYLSLAASTVAANVILRSSVAASFPLFSKQMFQNLGVQWACTLLGCLSAAMIPIPLALRVYGPALRRRSKHSSHA